MGITSVLKSERDFVEKMIDKSTVVDARVGEHIPVMEISSSGIMISFRKEPGFSVLNGNLICGDL